MKRLAPIALLALALTACGGSDEPSQATPTSSATSQATSTPSAANTPEPTSANDACAAVKNMPSDTAGAARWSEAFDELSALADNASLEATAVLLPYMEAALAFAKDPAPGQEFANAFELHTKAKQEYADRCK